MRRDIENQLRIDAHTKFEEAISSHQRGESDLEKKYFEEAITLFQGIEVKIDIDYDRIGIAHMHLASLYTGNYPLIIKTCRAAIEAMEKTDEKSSRFFKVLVECYHDIGRAFYNLKEIPKAIDAFECSISANEKVQEKTDRELRFAARAYCYLGSIYRDIQYIEKAKKAFDVSTTFFQSIQKKTDYDYELLAVVQSKRGSIDAQEKRFPEAIALLNQAIITTRSIQNKEKRNHLYIAETFEFLGDVQALDNPLGAVEAFQFSINAAKMGYDNQEELESFVCQVQAKITEIYYRRALTHMHQEENAEAIELYVLAIASSNCVPKRSGKDWQLLSLIHSNLGATYLKMNRLLEGRDAFLAAVSAAQGIPQKKDWGWHALAMAQNNLAAAYLSENNLLGGIDSYKAAIMSLQNIQEKSKDNHKLIAWTWYNLGKICLYEENWLELMEASMAALTSFKCFQDLADQKDWELVSELLGNLILSISRVCEMSSAIEGAKFFFRFLKFYLENFTFLNQKQSGNLDLLDMSIAKRLFDDTVGNYIRAIIPIFKTDPDGFHKENIDGIAALLEYRPQEISETPHDILILFCDALEISIKNENPVAAINPNFRDELSKEGARESMLMKISVLRDALTVPTSIPYSSAMFSLPRNGANEAPQASLQFDRN